MNHIYRLIWNALHQIWIAVAEFAHAYKKTAIVGAGIALNIMLFNAEAATGTQNITLIGDRNDYLLQEVTDIDGISGAKPDEKGSDGKAAYIFKTNNGVTADNNLISADKNTVIEGGKGGNGYANGNSPNVGLGGNGGEAINGDRLKINNNGDIKGGKGGTGGVSLDFKYGILGGNGGIAIHGNYLVIDNNKNSTISGGDGGHHGGYGATAILGNHLVINNKGLINGGTGAYGGYGANYINAGNAGAAIKGTNLKIYNSRSILGGNAQNGGYFLNNHTNTPIIGKGGHGGTAILGDNLEIINDTRGNIHGGNGGRNGLGSFDSQGGIGGDAINGNHLTIDNWGEIYGGQGYTGGNGGTGINGNNLKITNNSTGKINGGHGSNGGNAIAGANLTITNSGKIIKGQGDKAVGGKDDVVISLLSGKNSLTLKTGSDIQGDIDLAKGADNFLHIISDAKTTINGNLIAQDNTTVILSGKQVSFSQNAEFGDQTTLTFSEHASLHANKIIFDNTKISTNITNWDQNDIILASTDNGISGNYKHITNNLVSTGAKDYAGAILINEKKELAYGLKWNDLSGDSHGTFDLKEDSILNLHVKLKNNDHRNNNDWDGKSLTKDGLGILQLTTENNYTGTTNINNGTLKLGVANAIVNTSKLTVAKESILNLGGNNQIIQQLDNYGKILINDLKSQSLTKKITIKGNMYNSGTLVLNNCNNCAGQV
ncbi:MAG: hypothetical protein J6562_05465, partial [Candidatus Schmidhempelia sp.]|nr:hypothetical protein [Candidatus Schmidhempelia sp.]